MICGLFGKTRQAHYKQLWSEEGLVMKNAIIIKSVLEIRKDMPRIGTRKLHFMLTETLLLHAIDIGRDSLFDLLADYGMLVRKRKKRKTITTDSNHPFRKYPNMIRNLKDTWDWMNWYERSLVIFLLYGKPSNFRQNDVDHIHPKSVLASMGVDWNKINLLGNYQYLYYSDNRSKQAQEFYDWMEETFGDNTAKLNEFLELHTIPSDKSLWKTDKFDDFLEARRILIFQKLSKLIG